MKIRILSFTQTGFKNKSMSLHQTEVEEEEEEQVLEDLVSKGHRITGRLEYRPMKKDDAPVRQHRGRR